MLTLARTSLLLAAAILLAAQISPGRAVATPPAVPIVIRADAAAPGQPLVHFWSNTVGAGRANEGLRASWQEQLNMAARYGGFHYVRFHGLFHDDMFVYRVQDGKDVFDFQYVDDLFDRMLAQGVRPFVELGFSPSDMTDEKGSTGFWWKGNGSPPRDYSKWAELIRRFAQHLIARYGAAEVRSWYFEVWNEPNLHGFWTGTQAQYFELYRVTAIALKGVDPQLRVGGPATSNFYLDPAVLKKGIADGADLESLPWHPIWIEDFLSYCHQNRLPVDFVSTHPYPMDFEAAGRKMHRSVNSTRDDLRLLRKLVNASDYPHAEIHLTEWNSSPSSRDFTHDSLPAAAYIVKCNLDSTGLVDSLSYWTFTDVFEEQGAGATIFHGGFGLINYQGIPKPAFHAYRMLNALGDEELARTDGAIVTRERATKKLSALLYNYPPEISWAVPYSATRKDAEALTAMGSTRTAELLLTGLPPGASFTVETLDANHGNATAAWEKMGSPEPPTREETEELKREAWATSKELITAGADGTIRLARPIAPWSLLLVQEN